MEEHRDFTENMAHNTAAAESAAPKRALLDMILDPCPRVAFFIDDEGLIERAEGSLGNLGFRPEDLEGRDLRELLAEGYNGDGFEGFIQRRAPGESFEAGLLTRRRETVPVELHFFEATGRGSHVLLARDLRPGAAADAGFGALKPRPRSLGLLVSGICHEILNPLHIIYLSGQLLLADRKDAGEDAGLIQSILDEVKRIEVVTDGLLTFAGEKQAVSSVLDLNLVVGEGLELIEQRLRLGGIETAVHLDPDLPEVVGSPKQLGQALFNILDNARDAMEEGGSLTVATRYLGRDLVEISVEDTGRGIPEEELGCVFEPFYTTKPPGRGTGLGLSVAKSIIEDHRGEIAIRSSPGRGTAVTVRIPATREGELFQGN